MAEKDKPNERMRALGSKGGNATVRKHGRAHMSLIGKAGFTATSEKMGGPYLVVKMLQQHGSWAYIADKKVGGDHYDAYHARGSKPDDQ